LDFVDFCDAVDDVRHLLAEERGNLLRGDRRVFDRIMQQPGGDGRRVQLDFRQYLRHL